MCAICVSLCWCFVQIKKIRDCGHASASWLLSAVGDLHVVTVCWSWCAYFDGLPPYDVHTLTTMHYSWWFNYPDGLHVLMWWPQPRYITRDDLPTLSTCLDVVVRPNDLPALMDCPLSRCATRDDFPPWVYVLMWWPWPRCTTRDVSALTK